MTDDQKYVALMDKYKQLRGAEGEKAVKLLDAAIALRENGDVSEDAIIGGAYL